MHFTKPVLGFTAFSRTDTTTLIIKLLPMMKLQGLGVAVIKQSHHDIDNTEDDATEFRKLGADLVLNVTDQQYISDPEPGNLFEQLDLENIDLILVDGFNHLPFPKVELHRPSTGNKLIFPDDKSVIAVASDEYIETGGLPLLNINVSEEVAGFINRWLRNHPQTVQYAVANSDS